MLALAVLAARSCARGDIGTLQARVDNARVEARYARLDTSSSATPSSMLPPRRGPLPPSGSRPSRPSSRTDARKAARWSSGSRLATARLRVAQARFHREQNRLSRRLVAIYKSGTPDITSLLLELRPASATCSRGRPTSSRSTTPTRR